MADLAAWDQITEERIRTAQAEGQFDNLPGFGKPLPDFDQRDPNWWIKQKLRSERLSLLPPILEARLARERTLESLASFATEGDLRRSLGRLNEIIRLARLSPAPDVPIVVSPVDVEAAVVKWRELRRMR